MGVGFILGAVGVVFFAYGCRLGKLLLTITCVLVGVATAILLTHGPGQAVLAAVAGAALATLVALRMTRVALALVTGAWAGALMLGACARGGMVTEMSLLIASIVFCATVAIAFASFRQCMIFVTSLQGTMLLLAALFIVVAGTSSWWPFLRDALTNNPIFLPFCLVAGTVSGYYIQLAEWQERDSGMAGS